MAVLIQCILWASKCTFHLGRLDESAGETFHHIGASRFDFRLLSCGSLHKNLAGAALNEHGGAT